MIVLEPQGLLPECVRANGDCAIPVTSNRAGWRVPRLGMLLGPLLLVALGAIAYARWWTATSARDARGAAAVTAVAAWGLVAIVCLQVAWTIARRRTPRLAARVTQQWTERRAKLLLAGGSLVLSLAAAELAVRCWLPTPPLEWVSPKGAGTNACDWEDYFCEFDAVLGWRGIPYRRGEFTTAGERVWVEQNARGFRDIDHAPDTTAPRLVLLGDSFVWGAGVGQDETVSAKIRRQLADFDVYNLAVCGYGTDQTLLNFDRWADAIRPSEVCYLFFANDVTDNHSCENQGHAKPHFTLVDGAPRLSNILLPREAKTAERTGRDTTTVNPTALAAHPLRSAIWAADYFVSPRSVLYRHLRRANLEWRRRQPPMSLDPLTTALILRLRDQCKERGARFTLVLVPDRGVLKYSDGPEHYAALRTWCESSSIACLDLTPALLASPTSPYLFEGHWNATGHEIAAAAIARRVRDR